MEPLRKHYYYNIIYWITLNYSHILGILMTKDEKNKVNKIRYTNVKLKSQVG